MPNTRNTERVFIVRTDPNGNILSYEVVEQPIQSAAFEKPMRSPMMEKRVRSPVIEKPIRSPVIETRTRSPVIVKPVRSAMFEKPIWPTVFEKSTPINRLRSYSQSPKENWKKTYEEEEDNNDYEGDGSKENSTVVSLPNKKTRRDPSARVKRKPRRVRYVPVKSNVTIFDEKVDWNANPRIDTHNEDAIRRIQRAPQNVVFREKLDWHVQPRTDTHNEAAIENLHRMSSKRPIHDEKLEWKSTPRINDHNDEYLKYKEQSNLLRREKTYVQDFPQEWKPRPDRVRIDHHNPEFEEYKKRQKSAKMPLIEDRKLEWKPRPDRVPIDHHNPEFEEYKKRRKSAKLPPIEDRKLEWKKTPRINQKNDDYIERLRQKRSIPQIFKEKLRWTTKTPKIDAHNEEYVENLNEKPRPTIYNRFPRWRSQTKIDTGLESESEEEEYDDNATTA